MLSIDADAHVIECEKTWDYLEGPDKRYRPVPIAVDMPTGKKSNFWIIGGRLIGGRDNVGQDTSKESREMANIDSRLKHMDDIGTGVQVLYPTLFLRPVTDDPRIELALCKSYNRWMADIWSKDKKRLRWAVQLPLLTMDAALDELRWSKGNGACAVFMRGIETNHVLHDPYFFPLYEEASRLNMPIGIHSGIGNLTVNDMLGGEPFRVAKLIVIGGFHSMILNGIPEKFPKLRIGAIEVAAQWVPYIVHDFNLRFPKLEGKEARPDVLERQQPVVRRLPDRRRPALRAQVRGRELSDDRLGLRPCRQRQRVARSGEVERNSDIDAKGDRQNSYHNPAKFYGLDVD